MKKLAVLFIMIPIFLYGCTGEKVKLKQNLLKDYTFLIYMNGSDLESEHSAGTDDLYEMMKIGSDENINIIIETGGTEKWHNYYINPEYNQRWMVNKNKLQWLQDLEQRNMGSADTLSDFITWGINNYPAEKYALILWNHGGGAIAGFGYDERHYYDSLLLVEIEKALKMAKENTGETLEIIGFDACLMASLETADIVSPYTEYLVASAELEPAIGWEYSSFLQKAADGSLDGEELGKYIADGFYTESQKGGVGEMVTLSVIDTSKISKVVDIFENFVQKLDTKIEEPIAFNSLSRTISESEYYGGKSPEEGYSNMFDLGDLAINLGEGFSEERDEIISSVQEAVAYNITGEAKKNSTGISIYFPYYPSENLEYELPIYETIGFSDTYHKFAQKYTVIANNSQNSQIELAAENMDIQGDTYGVKIGKSMRRNVLQACAVLGKDTGEDKILLYGNKASSDYSFETGEVRTDFDNQLINLNDNPVYAHITNDQDDRIIYSIPAILNEEYVNIRAIYYKESDHYHIIGAWHGMIPENMAIRKEIIKLQEGDTIRPLLKEYDKNTEEIKTIEGEEFILKSIPEITNKKVKDEKLVIGFCIEDFTLNEYYTDFVNTK